MKGYIQVYTGNGKGKTTAAFGLALRAAGAGSRVYIAQFLKGRKYSEHSLLKRLSDLITLKQYGRKRFIGDQIELEDVQIALEGLNEIRKIMATGKYQLIILDEANIAVHYNLFSVDDLIKLIDSKPDDVELVITGRYANPKIIEKADLVTEMKEIKHYYRKGVKARVGIEK